MKRMLWLAVIVAALMTPVAAQNSLPTWVTGAQVITNAWTTITLTSRDYQWVRGTLTVDSLGTADTVFVAREADTLSNQYARLVAGSTFYIHSNQIKTLRLKTKTGSSKTRHAFQ
jgi:hypothetical protein